MGMIETCRGQGELARPIMSRVTMATVKFFSPEGVTVQTGENIDPMARPSRRPISYQNLLMDFGMMRDDPADIQTFANQHAIIFRGGGTVESPNYFDPNKESREIAKWEEILYEYRRETWGDEDQRLRMCVFRVESRLEDPTKIRL